MLLWLLMFILGGAIALRDESCRIPIRFGRFVTLKRYLEAVICCLKRDAFNF